MRKEIVSWKKKNKDLMNEKHKKTFKYLNYVKRLFNLASKITSCVLISAFLSLFCVPVDITSSAFGIKLWIITSKTKKCKYIIKKKKKKYGVVRKR